MDKLTRLTLKHKELAGATGYKFTNKNVEYFGLSSALEGAEDQEAVDGLARYMYDNFLFGPAGVKEYLDKIKPDHGISESAIRNLFDYGYLHDYTVVSRKKVVRKTLVDDLYERNTVTLGKNDYFSALDFSMRMLQKTDLNTVFGTFYDKIAKRNGTALNYIERHMIGKLGELAAVKLINSKLSQSGYTVENSFDTQEVESADIVKVKDRRGVLVSSPNRMQIKTAVGLGSMILKEDVSKLNSRTFAADYCIFVQLLGSPLVILVSILKELANLYSNDQDQPLDELLRATKVDQNSVNITAKVAGYVSVEDMQLVEKGQKLPPIGEIATTSRYAYVKNLNDDFSSLAQFVIPQRPTGTR